MCKRNSRRCTFITRPYQAIQLIAVRSGGGTIPLFPALDPSSTLKQELPYKRSLDPKISTGRAAVLD